MASTFTFTITAVDKATAVVNGINSSVMKMTAPMRAVQKSANNLKASIGSLAKTTGLDSLGRGLWRVGAAATNAVRRLGSMVPILGALTGVGVVAGITALAKGFGATANQVNSTARAIGVSTQALQQWEGAGRLAGLAAGTTSNAMRSVGQVFEDSVLGRNSQAAQVMQQYGIAVHRLKDGSVDAGRALQDVSRVAGGMSNAQLRGNFLDVFGLRDADALLGKGLPELEKKLQQAQAMGFAMTPDQIAAGVRYQQQMVQLELSTDKFRMTLGSSLAPAMERVIGLVTRLTDRYGEQVGSKIAEYVERIAKWIDETDWAKVSKEVGEFVEKIGGVKTIALALAAITFAGPIAGAVTLVGALGKVTAGVLALSTTALPALAGAPIVTAAVAAGAVAAPFAFAGAYLQHQMTGTESGIQQRIADREGRIRDLDELIELDPANADRYRSERAPLQRDVDDYKLKLAEVQSGSGGLADSAFGKLIASGEGDYNSVNRGAAGGYRSGTEDLENMTLKEVMKAQRDGAFNAAGRYQVIKGTLAEAASSMGLSGNERFDRNLQDRIFSEYLAGSKRPEIADYLSGKSDNVTAAVRAASKEWASVADPATGKSFHDGVANNRASISAQQMADALSITRASMRGTGSAHAMSPTAAQPRMIASAEPVGGSTSGNSSGGGTVDVNLTFNGAPPGTTASVNTSGNTKARIGHSGVTDAPL